VTREILRETKAAKINVPVLLLTGERSTDPAKPEEARRTRGRWCYRDSSTSPTSWTRRLSPDT
jgi:hypothetical protein